MLYYKWASAQENLSLGFLTEYDSNQSAQLQRLVSILKFCMKQGKILYLPIRE